LQSAAVWQLPRVMHAVGAGGQTPLWSAQTGRQYCAEAPVVVGYAQEAREPQSGARGGVQISPLAGITGQLPDAVVGVT
jgi:hypothetical protein